MKKDEFPGIVLTEEAINKKILSLMGLARKAGFAQGGEFLTEKAVKEGKSALVIVAGDASDNTKKNFSDMCTYYKVPYVLFADKDSLGHAIGAEFRASVTINNAKMAKNITDLLDNRHN